MDNKENAKNNLYPPVVTVLGHVDHGKTSLLDALRKSDFAEGEYGGITQSIGASSVVIETEEKKRKITFIDTPGHEAFAKMRGRGAEVCDIALLVVSAVDGVMPQTKESIKVLLESKIPFIVVLTKADLATKNLQKTIKQLLQEGIMLEGMGGNVPFLEVSAKTGQNIKELLELIILVFDLHKTDEDLESQDPRAVVIESRLDSKKGVVATAVIKKGILQLRDELYSDGLSFKVRQLLDDKGQKITEAGPGEAVEILGMQSVPEVGSIINSQASSEKKETEKPLSREMTYQNLSSAKKEGLALILATDTKGSLEAILASLPKKAQVLTSKTGEITEADILMAKSTGALVLGFNSRIRPEVERLAEAEKVLVKNYKIIYEMLDEVEDVLEGKRLAQMEQIFGKARVIAKFPFEKSWALGINVLEGRVAKGDKVRLMRNDNTIGESLIASLRVGKNPVSKVEKNHEAGLVLQSGLDFQVGDMLIFHN